MSRGLSGRQSICSCLEIPLSGAWAKTSLQCYCLTSSGPIIMIDSSCSVLQLIEGFLMQEALELLVQETNQYANLVTGFTAITKLEGIYMWKK